MVPSFAILRKEEFQRKERKETKGAKRTCYLLLLLLCLFAPLRQEIFRVSFG
jgi:hypothetical protein